MSPPETVTSPTGPAEVPLAGGAASSRRVMSRVQSFARYGVLFAMVLTFVTFSVLRPDAFLTVLTMKSILRDCAPLLIVALGVTVVLIMGEFDVSVGGLVALCSTAVAMLVSSAHVGLSPALAIILVLLIGATAGLLNGILIAYFNAPAFILTIAMGTVFAGLGLQLSDSSSIYEGVPESYVSLGNGTLLGLSNQIWIAVVVVAVAHVFLTHGLWGRYMYAIGGNPLTAALSGIRVRRLKAAGFALVGVAAAIAAVLLTSQAGAANPNTGLGLLLPAYAAAFLGASMFRVGVFTPLGVALGAIYLQIIGTGLTIMNLSGPIVQMIQGAILVGAIMLAVAVRR